MIHRLFRRRRSAAPSSAPSADPLALSRTQATPVPAGYDAADRAREFRSLFRGTPAGARVLAQLLGRCRVLDRAYVPGDPLETARREGMRDVGLWLLAMLEEPGVARPQTAEQEPAPSGTRAGERR